MESRELLKVSNLRTYLRAREVLVKAVDGVSFDIHEGEVFGLVGESGSGKSMTALSILGLLPPGGEIAGGKVLFRGDDLMAPGGVTLRAVRGGKIASVFQEPSTSLDPVFTIGEQFVETILAHRRMGRDSARALALEYLGKVHLSDPGKVFHDYPHQLSGGAKQRAMIAMALVNSPELLILDEPTTALDVSIQAGILDLLGEIIETERLSILFISHDFGVIARMCDTVAVMQKGRIVETGRTDAILQKPSHPYTMALLESVRALS